MSDVVERAEAALDGAVDEPWRTLVPELVAAVKRWRKAAVCAIDDTLQKELNHANRDRDMLRRQNVALLTTDVGELQQQVEELGAEVRKLRAENRRLKKEW